MHSVADVQSVPLVRRGGFNTGFIVRAAHATKLKQLGYQSLTEVYIELNPSLCEPSRFGRDGVRGALRQFLAEPSTRLAEVSLF